MNQSKLKELTSKIHYLPFGENYRPNLAAIVGSQNTLLVDAGNSPKHARLFLRELSKCDIAPIKYVALTHWHWDHHFGLVAMNFTSIAHFKTKEKIIELNRLSWDDESIQKRVEEGTENIFVRDGIKLEYPEPNRTIQIGTIDISFTEKLEIQLGDLFCIIENVGGDHSSDSSVLFVPDEKVVFTGDCLSPNPYRKDGKFEYRTEKLFPLLDKLKSYNAEYYVNSHGLPMPRTTFEKWCQEFILIGSLVEKRNKQFEEMLSHLKKKAQSEGKTIDNSWLEEKGIIIQAFLNGLD